MRSRPTTTACARRSSPTSRPRSWRATTAASPGRWRRRSGPTVEALAVHYRERGRAGAGRRALRPGGRAGRGGAGLRPGRPALPAGVGAPAGGGPGGSVPAGPPRRTRWPTPAAAPRRPQEYLAAAAGARRATRPPSSKQRAGYPTPDQRPRRRGAGGPRAGPGGGRACGCRGTPRQALVIAAAEPARGSGCAGSGFRQRDAGPGRAARPQPGRHRPGPGPWA